MIPRETGRGLSVGGAHRLAAVERLVGATLVVALPLNGATVRRPLLGHYRTGGVERRLSSRRLGSASGAACFTRRLGSASFRAPGMATWSGDSAGERCDAAGHPQGVPLRSSGIGSFKEVPHRRASGMIRPETGRGWSISGAHRVAAVERLVGATLVVALPPNGATVRRPLPGHYRTEGVERRLSSRRLGSASGAACFTRRLGPASFRAPGMATWSGDSAGERCDPAGHPQGVPLRSSGIGSFKEEEEGGTGKSPLQLTSTCGHPIMNPNQTHRYSVVFQRQRKTGIVRPIPETAPREVMP